MRESIFFNSIRAFCVTLAALVGASVGILLFTLLVGGFSCTSESSPEITYKYSPEILPNADGVRKALGHDVPVILTIHIKGVVGIDSLTHEKIEQQLIESREGSFKDDRVKGILLVINTPGGSAEDSDSIYRTIKAYKETYKVPVYAFVDGLCASGGMYIACAADKVYATDASLIGSVGVIMSTALNFYQLMEKIGVQSLTLYEGKGKDSLNPLRPWVKGEDENIKAAIDYFYMQFVDIVAKNRPNLPKQKLIDLYGANIYPATLAKEYGYIDDNNASLNATLKLLLEQMGIKDDKYQVVALTSSNWLSELFQNRFGFLSGQLTHRLELPAYMHPDLQNKFLYLHQ